MLFNNVHDFFTRAFSLAKSVTLPVSGQKTHCLPSLVTSQQVPGVYAQAYADDVVILAAGADARNLSERIQEGIDV